MLNSNEPDLQVKLKAQLPMIVGEVGVSDKEGITKLKASSWAMIGAGDV